MNPVKYHPKNIRPLSATYKLDDDIDVSDMRVYTSEGLGIFTINALSAIEDVTYNNYNPLFLTEAKTTNHIMKMETTKTSYPNYMLTYLKVKDNDHFVVINGNLGTVAVTGVSANMDDRYFCEIEFINPVYCTVRHPYDNALKYLTVNPGNSSAMTFTSRSSGSDAVHDRQIFNYVLDETNKTITLLQNLSTEQHTSIALLIQNHQNETDADGTPGLSAIPVPGSLSMYNSGNRFEYRDLNTGTVFNLQTTWNSYVSAVDDTTTDVSTSNSHQNIENNYVVTSTTNNISYSSHQIATEFIPLKNQVTPEGGVSRNNPYTGPQPEISHRSYTKLHTGTYEEYGNDSMHLSYDANIKEILIPADKLTYFHMPQVMSPYNRININDTTLLKSGAIAGNVPIKSDKVFKKLDTSQNSIQNVLVPNAEELNGTWLCSWLSGAPNSPLQRTGPIWVDRFFNSSFHTRTSALTSGAIENIVYIDKDESLTRKLGASAEHITIYDKMSDLTFEPGILYAYHHVGKKNSQKVINSIKHSLIAENLNLYKDYKLVNISVDAPPVYTFNADNFGTMNSVKHTGSFTLNFWMHNINWTKPIGDQIIGNYITNGFGIFNYDTVTPFIAIPDENKVHIYNSDFVYLHTHYINKQIRLFSKRSSSDNYWIVDDNNDIYEYTINGTIQNKISSSHLSGKMLIDLEISEDYLYILVKPNSDTAQYFKYNLGNRSSGYIGTLANANVWNFGTGASHLTAANIHSVSKGLSASTGVLVTMSDAHSGAGSSNVHPTSGSIIFGNGSMVDNNGSPWSLQNNKVYTYDNTISANILGVSSANIIEGIGCDKDNNIWVLHSNNKVSKLNNNRAETFTTTLSCLTGTLYNRFIDFMCEFDSNGDYQTYCITTNQSVSGAKFVKLSLSGDVISYTSILSGTKLEDSTIKHILTPLSGWKTTTGFDYARKTINDRGEYIKVKLGLSTIYNPSTTTSTYSAFTLSHPISALKSGWHNFCVVFDSERGQLDFYINTIHVDSKSVPQGRFSYSDIFDQPLTVGTSPFYTKLLLSEHLDQPQHYLLNGISMKNISLYDTALDYFDIKSLYTAHTDTGAMKWDIPIGKRGYIDTIERVFKHRIPGRKSEMFNVNIRNTTLTDSKLKSDVENIIKEHLDEIVPAYTKSHLVGWDNVYSTSVSSITGSVPSTVAVLDPNRGGAINGY